MFGDDISLTNEASLEECIKLCVSKMECLSLTYFHGSLECWLKNTKQGIRQVVNVHSTSWMKKCTGELSR